ncbi:MAG: HD domain-containing protein [Chloroflexota bacterium]
MTPEPAMVVESGEYEGLVITPGMSPSEKADAVEDLMIEKMTRRVQKSVLFTSGELDPTQPPPPVENPNQLVVMGDDPRLPKMPKNPTLMDFFKYRFAPGQNHLLQSARLALKDGHDEKIIIACLLHDIATVGFIRADHGYWGAQLVEPYVDEEVSWAIRAHQVLRFYADESVGFTYPEAYLRLFGEDFQPEEYIQEEYKRALNHKWYMTGRLITVNDVYSFDPNVKVDLEDFTDVIGRNFKQPEEGLGFDNSPVAHMWRTMIWPTKYL